MSFTHLHVHTEFSTLDGHSRIKALVAKAKKMGHTALAITDHGYMYGIINFYNECKANGIKPIIGVELYTAPSSIYDKNSENRSSGHIVLLAKNNAGYQNLLALAGIAATDGMYYKPRVDTALLRRYHEGIICLSACLRGDVPSKLLAGDDEGAYNLAREYKEIFGEDYYIELQDHGLEDQKTVLPKLIKLAKDMDIPVVATNDVHYVERKDAEAQHVLVSMSVGKTVDDESVPGFGNPDNWYFKSEDEMAEIFCPVAPEALMNTQVIADKCNVEIEMGNYHLPSFPLPEGWDNNHKYFRALCSAGLKKRYGKEAESHREQLEYETKVIEKMGFVDYFLIVFDIISFAKRNGIPVGPGRGSAAGSIVSYCLGITDLEPTKYDLLFERFLNPERITMPDVDIDVDPDGRAVIISHIIEKYGADHVAQIITYGTLAAKASIRDVGKALGMDAAVCQRLTKMIPNTPDITIKAAMAANKTLEKEYADNPEVKRLLDLCMSVEGLVRHTSTHAAGIIISPRPLREFLPVTKDFKSGSSILVSQFDMASVEQVGMLKVDLLGLKTLSVLKLAVENIRTKQKADEKPLILKNLRMADPAVFAMLSRGQTGGVFQLESEGMRDVLCKMKPSCFEDLIAAIALYRPGPMESIPEFIENKHNPEKVQYLHPLLEPILKGTYSKIVYQEQVMAIVRDLAGYSYGRADLVRRAMAKKKASVMEQEREYFIHGRVSHVEVIPGCIRNGISETVASQLWDQMKDFASYAFNKSHAACYAVIAYWTAYLRYYYPLDYLAALMTVYTGEQNKIISFLNDCHRQGIKILPPDINRSDTGFTVEGDAIRFGLTAIKETGKAVLAELKTERDLNGPFTDLQDLVERTVNTANKKTLTALIKSGALDCFPHSRAQMLAVLEKLLKSAAKARKNHIAEQISIEDTFFGCGNEAHATFHFEKVEYPENVKELTQREKLAQELEVIGFYVSGHPMSEFEDKVNSSTTHRLVQLIPSEENPTPQVNEGEQVRVAGCITSMRQVTTKKRSQMCFATIEDQTGRLDITVFPRAFEAYGSKLAEGVPVLVYGKVEISDFGIKVIADSISFLDDCAEN